MNFYIPALLFSEHVPFTQAITCLVFATLLAGYLVLLTNGPRTNTVQGLVIQATDLKGIVYASLVSLSVQACWMLRWQITGLAQF